jgi:hypothetical protein
MPTSIPIQLPVAGLLIDVVSGAAAMLAGLAGLFGGTAHYLALFAGRSKREVEVRTGGGFFIGMAFGIAVLISDLFV